MNHKKTEEYFSRVKAIWQPWEIAQTPPLENVIPFCTPIIDNPEVLLIGINHARFDDGEWPSKDVIGDEFATKPARINTYSFHNHNFAKQLRATIEKTTGLIFAARDHRTRSLFGKWIGTNRCPVQCHVSGQGEVKKRIREEVLFDECQKKMDNFLRELITETEPKYVLLSGKLAIELFRDDFQKQDFSLTLKNLQAIDYGVSRLVPLMHISWAPFKKHNSDRLKELSLGLGWSEL